MNFQTLFGVGLVGVVALAGGCFSPEGSSEQAGRTPAAQWRAEHRIIDLHQHLNGTTQHLTLVELEAGRSSQATLLGRDEMTVESLYLSPRLAAQLEARPALGGFRFPSGRTKVLTLNVP